MLPSDISCLKFGVFAYFSFLFVQLTDGVDERVWSKDDARALWPLCAHQGMFTKQDLTNVFSASHANHRFPQEVGLKDIAVFLSPGDVKAGTLRKRETKTERQSKRNVIITITNTILTTLQEINF